MPYQYMPGYQPYYQPPMADQLAQLRGAQYQPMPQQMPQVQPQQAQVSGQSMVWVNGEQEAMGYLVEYATKQDLEALAARVEALSAKEKPARKAAAKEDAE